MAYCKNCGKLLEEDEHFCTSCGTPTQEPATAPPPTPMQQKDQAINDTLLAVLSYLGILFLIPLIMGKSEFVRFHTNQGLVLLIADVICAAVPLIGLVGTVCLLVFRIMGIVYAAQNQMKELPLIGQFKIL